MTRATRDLRVDRAESEGEADPGGGGQAERDVVGVVEVLLGAAQAAATLAARSAVRSAPAPRRPPWRRTRAPRAASALAASWRAWLAHLGRDGRPASHTPPQGAGSNSTRSYQCAFFWAAHASWMARSLPEIEEALAADPVGELERLYKLGSEAARGDEGIGEACRAELAARASYTVRNHPLPLTMKSIGAT